MFVDAPVIAAVARVRERCHAAGLDVTHGFDLAAFVDGEHGPPTPRFGRAHAQALVVGNSRAMWPKFLAVAQPDDPHPLDAFVEHTLATALADCPLPMHVLFGHVADVDGFWPLQRMAAAAGLGRLAPSHLLIHPTLGPWLALRAVVVFDADVDPACVDVLPAPPACDCARGCEIALAHAQRARGADAWRAWLAVRDACPVGAGARYDDEQLRYHYTSAGSLLRRARPAGPVPTLD